MKLLFFFTFIFFHISVNAIFPFVRNFYRDNYKAGTQNWAITQDSCNTMYFANNSGLLAFDGNTWRTFPMKNQTSVRSVCFAHDGRFYATSFNEFGFFKKESNGNYAYESLSGAVENSKIGSNDLFKIIQGNKSIYFQSDKTIFEYDGKIIRDHHFDFRIDASAFIYNTLFVASAQKGAFILNGGMEVHIAGSELLLNKTIVAILPYNKNKVLFVSSLNGVYCYDGVSVMPFNTGIDDFLRSNQVFCAATNGNQLVYGTVQRGVAVQNLNDGSVYYLNTNSGLQNNTVLSVAFDNLQNIWLGLDKGIAYVMLNGKIMSVLGANSPYGSGYTSFVKNNVAYFGTNQGLYYTSYPLSSGPASLQLRLIKGMEGQIWSLTEIDNTLFCCSDRGVFMVNADRTEQIDGLSGAWTLKNLISHPGIILGCSYQGLFVLKKAGSKWALSHFVKGGFNESSPMFEEESDGSVWFSHWLKGMYRLFFDAQMERIVSVDVYDDKKGFPNNQNNTVFRINNRLVFSSEKGFFLFNSSKQMMEPFEQLNHLFAGLPYCMRLHESPSGDIWFASGSFLGFAKKMSDNSYQLDSVNYRLLQRKMLPGFEHFNYLNQSNLLLSTDDGFCWINTNDGIPPKRSFKVFLQNIVVNNDKIMTINAFKLFDNKKLTPTFPHQANSLRFEYVAPEYRSEGMVYYSYMLENYDKSWSGFDAGNKKEYTKLPKGRYTFKIRATNMLEPRDAYYAYTFEILPAWYESKPALFGYTLLFILGVTGLIFLINKRSKIGALEMESRKEKEIVAQKEKFEADAQAKKREIKELKNQQLQYELRHKSQELASSAMNLLRKNELLQDLLAQVSSVEEDLRQKRDTGSLLSRLSKMEKVIKENIVNDDSWKRFEENFDLVYENYLKRLASAYPDLSQSDKKLCAYLKMGLSSKDISQLMNMSIRSVEMNRYRLRKKMGIDRETNLSDFLQRF